MFDLLLAAAEGKISHDKEVRRLIVCYVSGFRVMKVKGRLIQIQRRWLRPNWGWTEMPTRRKRRKRRQWWKRVQVRPQNCSA